MFRSVETAATVAMSLARWFLDTAGAPDGRGRMAAHIARIGPPEGCDAPAIAGQGAPTPGKVENGVLVALEFGQMQVFSHFYSFYLCLNFNKNKIILNIF